MELFEGLNVLTILVRIIIGFLLGTLIYYWYCNWIEGKRYEKDAESPDKKIAIVTGASQGIGKEIAYGLAKRGLHVVMACKNMNEGLRTKNEIIAKTGNQNVKLMHLNLSSFKSIRTFANEFLNTELRLDILINNANVLHLKRELTEDGIEQTIGINYFGHFLLTMLLIGRMSRTTPTRIINTTNWVHRCVNIDQTDLMNEKQYCGFNAYARSALANIYFTLALSERIENTGITCNCIHPGISLTRFIDRQSALQNWRLPKQLAVFIAKFLFKSEKSCADTTIFAAVDFSVQNISGVYLSNNEIGEIGANSTNRQLAEWLWCKSEEITGEKLPDLPNNFKFLKKQPS